MKIRQPLAFASYSGKRLDLYYEQIMRDELNVKRINWVEDLRDYTSDACAVPVKIDDPDSRQAWVEISKELTPELKREGLSREVIRVVQKARKDADLNVDDRITLNVTTKDSELVQALAEWQAAIQKETLATSWSEQPVDGYSTDAKANGVAFKVSLAKAAKH